MFFNIHIVNVLTEIAAQNPPAGQCLVVIHLRNLNFVAGVANQVLGEVVAHSPEEVFGHIAKAVTLAGQHEHVKALVGADECINHSEGVAGVYVIVDVTGYEHQMAL